MVDMMEKSCMKINCTVIYRKFIDESEFEMITTEIARV